MEHQIPPILAVLLPLIAKPLGRRLASDGFPQWLNAAIALFIALAATISWLAYAHTLTGNIFDNIALGVVYLGVLMADPLRPLYDFGSIKLAAMRGLVVADAPGEDDQYLTAGQRPIPRRASLGSDALEPTKRQCRKEGDEETTE